MARLSTDAIREGLKRLQGWDLTGETISKKFSWLSFAEAMKFVNHVAELAERADHHPDILINYRRVTLVLSTHSEGGISQKDLDLATQIEESCSKG